jgi:putative hydrolase of the HAD superfamily
MIDSAIRAVFFDAVGTLIVPSAPVARTYVEFGRRHGVNCIEDEVRGRFRDAFARQEEIDRESGWRTNEARERARWRAIVSEVLPGAEGAFDELWAWFSSPAAWTIHPEAGEVLRELANRRIAVGMASNFDSRLLGLVESFPELAPVRGRCAISSLIGWRKPAPEFFRNVAQRVGCPTAQVLHVGDDRKNDVEGAIAAGLRAILYDPEGADNDYPHIRRLRDLLPA